MSENYANVGFVLQGFLPGVFGVSHGALQFMAYEELKKLYFQHYELPVNTRLVSHCIKPQVSQSDKERTA